MKIAICFSGQIRSLEHTHKNIINFLDKSFDSYETFAHVPLDENSNKFLEYFNKATVVIEKDPKIKKTKLKNKQFETVKHKFGSRKAAKLAHMLQLYGIYRSNSLKTEFEIKNNIKFDWVVRCRTDLLFYNNYLDLTVLNKDKIYSANFHHYGGINDRVVISSSKNMNIFSDLYNHIQKYKVDGFNAENIFKNYLIEKNISTDTMNLLNFNRVRSNGEELQDFNKN